MQYIQNMRSDNQIDLIITKFNTASAKQKHKLLTYIFENHSGRFDQIVDFLNYVPVYIDDKNIKLNDWINIDLDISAYPKPSVAYYQTNKLVEENNTIRVKVVDISPIESYCWLEYYTDLTIVSKVKVYTGHIKTQEDLLIF